MDDSVGKTLDALRRNKIEENTLVFFVGDNGGPTGATTCRNGLLRGVKGQVYEGGKLVGYASISQVTIGAQIGGQSFSQVVFFETREAIAKFKESGFAIGRR